MTEPVKPNPPSTAGIDDDLPLIERVLAGDRRAFEPLVRRHERRVYRVTLAVLGNSEDAEEAMQDAFVKTHQAFFAILEMRCFGRPAGMRS